jgi:hypothetical protein
MASVSKTADIARKTQEFETIFIAVAASESRININGLKMCRKEFKLNFMKY